MLGCSITVESDNVSPCVELAESLTAALEGLLSTGTVERIVALEPSLTISVRKSVFASTPFEFETNETSGRPDFSVTCSEFSPHKMSPKMQAEFKEKLLELLARIFASVFVADNLVQIFEGLVRDELALDRSLNFTGSFITVGNVLGYKPKAKISDWPEPETREYPVRRDAAWDAHTLSEKRADSLTQPPEPGEGEVQAGSQKLGQVKQNEIQTVSLIRDALWARAGWAGTVFATSADDTSPPILALAFSNKEVGVQIFNFWRDELGTDDKEERLRIAIVRGVSDAEPYAYRVVVGSNPDYRLEKSVQYGVFVSRVHTMHPNSGANLERFLLSYLMFKRYLLMPAQMADQRFELLHGHELLKREIHVRYAWEIGVNDADGAAIKPDDNPIIPPDQREPPVLGLLKMRRGKQRHSGSS